MEKLKGLNLKGSRKLVDVFKREIALSALDLADVTAIETRQECQLLLRKRFAMS